MQHLSHLYSLHPGLLIVTPTTPNAGWSIHPGDLKYGCSNGNMQVRNMEYAWLANFVGCPAMSAPVGYLDVEEGKGMTGKVPVSLMVMAEWGAEDECIAFGYDVERWLHEGLEGGRVRAGGWVDVIELASKGGVADGK
jgi:Asp-tRNA(Asn)/Glu-tRNA(Gln) amidotransferase A subunit family amidase